MCTSPNYRENSVLTSYRKYLWQSQSQRLRYKQGTDCIWNQQIRVNDRKLSWVLRFYIRQLFIINLACQNEWVRFFFPMRFFFLQKSHWEYLSLLFSVDLFSSNLVSVWYIWSQWISVQMSEHTSIFNTLHMRHQACRPVIMVEMIQDALLWGGGEDYSRY